MLPPAPVVLGISDPSMVGEARRVASSLAIQCGFNATRAGKIAIVVSEAAKNLTQHAGGGQILIQPTADNGLDILALDRGRGIPDLGRAFEDGYSTAGTAGNGMGAMKRLADDFDIHSLPGGGTAILCRFTGTASAPEFQIEIGGVSTCKPGENVCGDAWTTQQTDDRALIFVVDGLGHGIYAAEAAAEAIRIFHAVSKDSPVEILRNIHDALRKTRGAAGAVAEIRSTDGSLNFAGVGNISATILRSNEPRHLVSHNGTLGHEARKFQQFTYPWHMGDFLIMCSDGLNSQWRAIPYNALLPKRATLIAGVLYREHVRGRDDATVVVAKSGTQG